MFTCRKMIELKQELDKLMSSLTGVLAARTVLNDQDEIIEIHILSDLSKSPKQLVRDIQSATMAAFGLDIDYRLISVAQVNNNMMLTPPSPEPRLLIRKITISLDSSNLETSVVLAMGDKSFEGSSRGPLTGRNRIYSAINASLNALKTYLGQPFTVNLIDLQRSSVAGNDCFIVAISYIDPHHETVLYGIAAISNPETEVQSAVMAVLSALNRVVGKAHKGN